LLGHPVFGCPIFVLQKEVRPLSTNEREKRVRVNRQIRISPLRVIGPVASNWG